MDSGSFATCATSVIVKERPEPKLRMIATTLLVTLRRGSEPLPATDPLSLRLPASGRRPAAAGPFHLWIITLAPLRR